MSEVNRIIEILARVSDPRREPTQHEQDGRLLYHHIATLTDRITDLEIAAHRDGVQHHKTRTAELEARATITTLTAELEKHRKFLRAVKKMQQGGCISTCLGYIEEIDSDEWDEVYNFAAQLKEQDDDKKP